MTADTSESKDEVSETVSFWKGQIEIYEQKFSTWEKRGKEIINRYRDERKGTARNKARFNILWSNVQTLSPAIYASTPKPNIDRRFQDDDDLGRYSALVLERSVSYFVNNDMFDKVMKQVVLDRLLPGRGVTWIRYVPTFQAATQITDDADAEESQEELSYEDVIPDYVHWQDFGHTWARTWQEVRAVWRIAYMSRSELIKRFGKELGRKIPLDAKPAGKDDADSDAGKKATIYEIWDKAEKKAVWLHKSMQDVLDERDDPLRLKDFFPCPEPLYATLVNDDLIPSPDYLQYQDQAMELDMLTGRITSITKALKVAGVYDGSAQGLDRLLSENVENTLIPVDQWAVMGDKGLQGAISFLPIAEIVQTLISLYEGREKVKQDLYEITGISDIVRGATNANETATAQKIKGQFATLRLDNQQKDVARFSCDMVRIMTEIIAEHFSLDTIKQISGVKLLTEQEKQQIQMQQQMMQRYQQVAQQAQQAGQQPPPPPQLPPLDDKVMELMEMPSWEDVEGIIRNDAARCFRIDIETDSTIKTDQEAEKQARMEFLGAVGGFMQQAAATPPSLQPLVMQMLMFGVRGFKVSRELETEFETAISKIKKEAENPQPQPDPEQIKAQAEEKRTQAEMQIQDMKAKADMANIQAKAQADQQKGALEMQKIQLDLQAKAMDIELKKLDLMIKEAGIEEKKEMVEAGNALN